MEHLRRSNMKLTIAFTLIATLFLVSAQAGTRAEVEAHAWPQTQEDFGAVADRGIWSGIYWTLKAALKTLKGLNCTIKEVEKIRLACLQFLESTKSCGDQVSKQVQAVIDSVNAILSTCNDIINLNTNVCGNGAPLEDDNAVPSGKTGLKCFAKLLKKMLTLKNQMQKTIKLIKALPADTSDCYTSATNSLTGSFTAFPDNIKTCSKLTSN